MKAYLLFPFFTVYGVQCIYRVRPCICRQSETSPLVIFHLFDQAGVFLYAIGNRPGCMVMMVRTHSMTGSLCRWVAVTYNGYFMYTIFVVLPPSLWSFFHIYLFSCNLVGDISHTLCILWWQPHLSYYCEKNHSCNCKSLLVLCERWKQINWTELKIEFNYILKNTLKLRGTKAWSQLHQWPSSYLSPGWDHRIYMFFLSLKLTPRAWAFSSIYPLVVHSTWTSWCMAANSSSNLQEAIVLEYRIHKLLFTPAHPFMIVEYPLIYFIWIVWVYFLSESSSHST